MSKLDELRSATPCCHEFSWPQQGATGVYYQICAHCGCRYSYDWNTLTRRDGIEEPAEEIVWDPTRRPWIPRAPRLRTEQPISYRRCGKSGWHSGILYDISESGVLLEGDCPLPDYSDVEIVFEMPEAISGKSGSWVLCRGYVARSGKSRRENQAIGIAIAETRFLASKPVLLRHASAREP